MLVAPVALAVAAADAAALAALAAAALPASRVVRGWEEAATRAQLQRERDAERVSLLLRAAIPCLLVATVLLVLAVARLLPPLVPGAMCGTGVLAAASGLGERALFTRLLAAAALWALAAVDGVDRRQPVSHLSPSVAKGALVVLPLAVLAAWDTGRFLFGLDVVRPVDCCASAVAALSGGAESPVVPGGPAVRLGGLAVLGLALAVLAPRVASRRAAWALGAGVALFVPVASSAVLADLVPYHYGVLGHHCPWCLFLPQHRGAGWPLAVALAAAALEAAAAVAVAAAWAGDPSRARLRRAGLRVALAAALFLLVAAAPAAAWWLRNGVFL